MEEFSEQSIKKRRQDEKIKLKNINQNSNTRQIYQDNNYNILDESNDESGIEILNDILKSGSNDDKDIEVQLTKLLIHVSNFKLPYNQFFNENFEYEPLEDLNI